MFPSKLLKKHCTKLLQNYLSKLNLLGGFLNEKSEFKKLTLDKAKKDLEKNKKDLFNLRFQQINGQLTNTSKFNQIKKTIAKLLTFIERKKSA